MRGRPISGVLRFVFLMGQVEHKLLGVPGILELLVLSKINYKRFLIVLPGGICLSFHFI